MTEKCLAAAVADAPRVECVEKTEVSMPASLSQLAILCEDTGAWGFMYDRKRQLGAPD